MAPIKLLVYGSGAGTCSLSGKDTEGLTVTFEDGTVKEAFLSWKSFRQILQLKLGQGAKPESKQTVPVSGNGPAVLGAK